MSEINRQEMRALLEDLAGAKRSINNAKNRMDAAEKSYELTQLNAALGKVKDSLDFLERRSKSARGVKSRRGDV